MNGFLRVFFSEGILSKLMDSYGRIIYLKKIYNRKFQVFMKIRHCVSSIERNEFIFQGTSAKKLDVLAADV